MIEHIKNILKQGGLALLIAGGFIASMVASDLYEGRWYMLSYLPTLILLSEVCRLALRKDKKN